jgi:hypothetical protein
VTIEIRDTTCNCHPETCACAPCELVLDGEVVAHGQRAKLDRLQSREAELERALLLTTAALHAVSKGRFLHLEMIRAAIANAEALMTKPVEPANDAPEPVVCPKCAVLREVMAGARDPEVNAHRAACLARWGKGPDDSRGDDDPAARYLRGLYAIHLIDSMGPGFEVHAAVKAGAAALKRCAAWVAADLSDADAERCVESVLSAISPPAAANTQVQRGA